MVDIEFNSSKNKNYIKKLIIIGFGLFKRNKFYKKVLGLYYRIYEILILVNVLSSCLLKLFVICFLYCIFFNI